MSNQSVSIGHMSPVCGTGPKTIECEANHHPQLLHVLLAALSHSTIWELPLTCLCLQQPQGSRSVQHA